MAIHAQSRATNASPQTVWRIWSDPGTWPSWNPDVEAISLTKIAAGATGTMTTRAGGTHDIRIASFETGRAFQLVSTGIPGHRLAFSCQVVPEAGGSRISQGVEIRGPLGVVFNGMMGKKIAESFGPLLDGLKNAAEADGE